MNNQMASGIRIICATRDFELYEGIPCGGVIVERILYEFPAAKIRARSLSKGDGICFAGRYWAASHEYLVIEAIPEDMSPT